MDTDPTSIETPAALASALQRLRQARGLSLNDIARAAEGPRLSGQSAVLPRSTVSDILAGKSMPAPGTLVALLTVCGVSAEEQAGWLAARERAATIDLRRPPGAVRVRAAQPRLLGVHACIQVDPRTDDLPVYVPRDRDADVRGAITTAASGGGMVLLTGGSSVGKTRMLFEAVRTVLPDWWLLHPGDAVAVRLFAENPTPRTVVWLDELQRYLNHPAGLPAAVVRALITAGTVLVGTLWPDEYIARTVPRAPGRPDPHAGDREVLGLSRILDVPSVFSVHERQRAEQLSRDDPRIRLALNTAGEFGPIQILAAGPELVRRWENAPDINCYGKAIITAALDARRVGAHGPLTTAFLGAAAPAYLAARQRACAPVDWLEQAIEYATRPVHGAAACLTPHTAGMGEVVGYLTADYLHQHARTARRAVALTEDVWHALIRHHPADDTIRLAYNAERRNQIQHATTLYRQAANACDDSAMKWLTRRLLRQGCVEEAIAVLQQCANVGNWYAASTLADLLAKHDRVDEAITLLRRHSDGGNRNAGNQLASHLRELDRVDEAIAVLRKHSDAGDESAAGQVSRWLIRLGRVDEAITALRQCADANADDRAVVGQTTIKRARDQLIEVLREQDRVDEAITVLRQRVQTGDESACYQLIKLLAEHDRDDKQTTRMLLMRARAGDTSAAYQLAWLLARLGRAEELRQHADAGDSYAADWLAQLLANLGRVEELRQRADAGDSYAAGRLAGLLAAQDRVDDAITVLRQHPNVRYLTDRLVELLKRHGRVEELRELADAGDGGAASHLATLLTEQGQIDDAITVLRRCPDGVNVAAHLTNLLEKQDRIDEAITVLQNVEEAFFSSLAGLLADHGRVDEAIAVLQRHAGEREFYDKQMVEILVQYGRIDELRQLTEAGDERAADHLVALLIKHSRIDEAITELRQRADAGHWSAADRLARLLAEQNRADELRQRADAGDILAAEQLVALLAEQGRLNELEEEVLAGTYGAIDLLTQLRNSRVK